MSAYQSISVADANGDNEDDQEVGHTHHNNSSQHHTNLPQTRHHPHQLFYLAIAIVLLITFDWARLRFTSPVDNIEMPCRIYYFMFRGDANR